MDFRIFVPITKVDVGRRLVYGAIAEEVPDKSGEIMDYATAKPQFEAWSSEIAKASGGRSVGNLRAMHGQVAAGKLETISFDDDAKRIEACGKVVDDAEWNKVLEGVYTGFSMGGKYVKRWKDANDPSLTRYTPKPLEVSLVDNPCIPTATFEVVKEDGSSELRKFRTAHPQFVTYADPGYQPDGKKRYPIDTAAHVRAAWTFINRKRNADKYGPDQLAKVKARIVAAWKDMIDKSGPPAAQKCAMHKSLAEIGDISGAILTLERVKEILQTEAAIEGDNSPAPDHLESIIDELCDFLVEMTVEETGEIAGEDETSQSGDDSGARDADDGDMGDNDMSDAAENQLADKLAGVVAERNALAKALATLPRKLDAALGKIDAQAARIAALEAQPAPGGAVRMARAVTKAEDAGGSAAPGDPYKAFMQHLETLSPGERALALMKFSLATPLSRVPDPVR